MEIADMTDVGRKMRGADGTGRIMVLDVDYSSTKYHIFLSERAARHAYYLRPPEGMTAYDLQHILDEAGGEEVLEFRYFVYPELQTELKPLLSADPYAGKYFDRDDDRRYLQIEGERIHARAAIAQLLESLKVPFDAKDFPRINEFSLRSFKAAESGHQSEVVILRTDEDRNELRKSEPGFHVAVAEHGFAREIDLHRPMLADTQPVVIFSSNEHASALGHAFLNDLAAYFASPEYSHASTLPREEPPKKSLYETVAPPPPPTQAAWAVRIEPPKVDPAQLLTKIAAAMYDQLPGMKLLQKRKAIRTGPHLTIQFPGTLGFGKGPNEAELRELGAVHRSIKADSSFGSEWRAFYQVDKQSGDLRIEPSLDTNPPTGWTVLH
ncbi:MAG TPA: hypothetical protein VG944_06980 [Fimbriimonas sp.]|nr:hypothetical protein [Fimbriimonas sp.]